MDNDGFENESFDRMEEGIASAAGPSGRLSPQPQRPKQRADLERSSSVTSIEEQITFSWDGLTVSTAGKGERSFFGKKSKGTPSKTIVNNACGYVKPGEVLAIMGASGAGKSTLLNSLTFKNLKGLQVSGERFIDGVAVNATSLTAVSAYIQQDDLFIGTLTPREHLDFMARLRMDRAVPWRTRRMRVDAVVRELGLTKCEHTLIGVSGRVKGISGGESKRLAFAAEVLTNPPLLFCDEPTSGLDAHMAQNVVETLRSLAKQGKAIICTIHQPSSQVFALFDRVLLMAEGKMAYLGGIDETLRFFAKAGYPCPEMFNPADHYVHVLAISPGAEDRSRTRVQTICQAFEESEEGHAVKREVLYQRTHQQENALLEKSKQQKKRSPYRASWWQQFRALLWRSWLSVIKEPAIIKVNLIQTVFVALLIGIIFLQQDYDQDGVANISGCLFTIVINLTFNNVFSVINVFTMELPIFLREHFNGTYRTDVYFLAKQLVEMPVYVVFPCIFISILYWMIGLNPDVDRFFMCLLISVLLVQVIISYGYFISTVSPSMPIALAVAAPLITPTLLLGGFYVRSNTLPDWLAWVEYVSWFKYGNELLVINQWRGYGDIACPEAYTNATVDGPADVVCSPADSAWCPPGGVVHVPENNSYTFEVREFCLFTNGEDVIVKSGLNENNFVFDLCMLVVMFIALRVSAFLCLLARTYRKH